MLFNNCSPEFTKKISDVENIFKRGFPKAICDKKNSDKSSIYENKAVTIPPGRIFFRWFPYPHLVGIPLEGLRNTSLKNFYVLLGELSTSYAKKFFATPYHVLLSMKIYPWYDNKRSLMRFENAPDWLGSYLRSAVIDEIQNNFVQKNQKVKFDTTIRIEQNGDDYNFFETLLQRQKRCAKIVELWKKLKIIDKITVTDDMAIETRLGNDNQYIALVQEEVLCYHDELACQITYCH